MRSSFHTNPLIFSKPCDSYLSVPKPRREIMLSRTGKNCPAQNDYINSPVTFPLYKPCSNNCITAKIFIVITGNTITREK